MSKKKKSFAHIWASQSDIGKMYGLSAIAVGKILISEGYRDPVTKLPTAKAFQETICKSTPLKTGEPFFMWHQQKLKLLIESKGEKRISIIEQHANEVIAAMKSANRSLSKGEEDTIAKVIYECAYFKVPEKLIEQVKAEVAKKGY